MVTRITSIPLLAIRFRKYLYLWNHEFLSLKVRRMVVYILIHGFKEYVILP
jgi:hypothetical protein